MEKVILHDKLSRITEYWQPFVAGELNGQQVKLAKFKGEFIWHHHEQEDEMFLVVKGKLMMHFRGEVVELNEGEFIIVPRGVEHKPVAPEEVSVMLFEPASTLNTGNVLNERTRKQLDSI
jgi:mannose-6-phosphate isomerase-like protein (cupin superfamily)